MHHEINISEVAVTSDMDFVVPLKQIGLITRAVLEGISYLHRPRRIIIVAPESEENVLNALRQYWDTVPLYFIPEESFFLRNFNLPMAEIIAHYDQSKDDKRREPGWWIQQLIKLGAGTQIPFISDVFVVWDGDLVPTRRWKLCETRKNIHGGDDIHYFIAILQEEARSVFNTTQYSRCMEALTGYTPLEPKHGGTFVAHHMVFHKQYLREMLEHMQMHTGQLNTPWPILIMSQTHSYYRFSEYKTYASFMKTRHPDAFHYHPLTDFGKGGLRFRSEDAQEIADILLRACCGSGSVDGSVASTPCSAPATPSPWSTDFDRASILQAAVEAGYALPDDTPGITPMGAEGAKGGGIGYLQVLSYVCQYWRELRAAFIEGAPRIAETLLSAAAASPATDAPQQQQGEKTLQSCTAAASAELLSKAEELGMPAYLQLDHVYGFEQYSLSSGAMSPLGSAELVETLAQIRSPTQIGRPVSEAQIIAVSSSETDGAYAFSASAEATAAVGANCDSGLPAHHHHHHQAVSEALPAPPSLTHKTHRSILCASDSDDPSAGAYPGMGMCVSMAGASISEVTSVSGLSTASPGTQQGQVQQEMALSGFPLCGVEYAMPPTPSSSAVFTGSSAAGTMDLGMPFRLSLSSPDRATRVGVAIDGSRARGRGVPAEKEMVVPNPVAVVRFAASDAADGFTKRMRTQSMSLTSGECSLSSSANNSSSTLNALNPASESGVYVYCHPDLALTQQKQQQSTIVGAEGVGSSVCVPHPVFGHSPAVMHDGKDVVGAAFADLDITAVTFTPLK